MGRSTVYVQKDIFDEVTLFPSEGVNSIYFPILEKHTNVMLDIEQDVFDKLIADDEIYKRFLKKEVGLFDTLGKSFPTSNGEDSDLSEFPKDLILVKDGLLDTGSKRRTEGAFVYQQSEIGIATTYYSSFGYSIRSTSDNWQNVLTQKSLFPANAMVLVDNYIHKRKTDYDNRKAENLFSILSEIVKPDLTCEFHLLIVADNSDGSLDVTRGKELLDELEAYGTGKLGVNLKAGLITHTKDPNFHERVIITNHHVLTSDRGFAVIERGRIKNGGTKGQSRWVFAGVKDDRGEICSDERDHHLNCTRSLIKTNSNSSGVSNFNLGHIENRLLD